MKREEGETANHSHYAKTHFLEQDDERLGSSRERTPGEKEIVLNAS